MPKRRHLRTAVPNFSLYGEIEKATDAEFVHVEDIRSRSALYGWEITSHAHRGLYQVVLVLDGGAHVRIDDAETRVVSPAVITVAPGVVHGFRFLPETRGFVLTIAEAMLFGGSQQLKVSFQDLLEQSGVVDLGADRQAATRLEATLEHLASEFRWPQHGRDLMLDWLVRTCLLQIIRQRTAVMHAARSTGSREDVLAQFRVLVEEHYREHWAVERYARALHVTESRLNRICRALLRKSAFDVVQDRLLLEARRRLTYITAPAALIAEELGFRDPAYFSRYFKRMTGFTPSAYRQGARRS